MKFHESKLKGLYVIELQPFIDERGYFVRSYCDKTLERLELIINESPLGENKEFKAILDRKTRYEETEYVSEEGGAGEWGTDKLTNKYISDTPGQSKKKKKNEKV